MAHEIYLYWEKRLTVLAHSDSTPAKISDNYELFKEITADFSHSGQQKFRHQARFYAAHLHQDLLGDWILTKTRGGLNTTLGQHTHQFCKNYTEGLRALETLKKIRKQRNYKLFSEKYG